MAALPTCGIPANHNVASSVNVSAASAQRPARTAAIQRSEVARIADAPTNHALVKNYGVLGVHWAAYQQRAPELVQAWQREIEALWDRRAIDPLVGAEYAFEDLPAALGELAARRTTGRVVLVPPA